MTTKTNDDDWGRFTVKVHPDHIEEFHAHLKVSEHVKRSYGWVMPSKLWRRIRELQPRNPGGTARAVLDSLVTNLERRRSGDAGEQNLKIAAPAGLGDRLAAMAEVTGSGSVSAEASRILEDALEIFEEELKILGPRRGIILESIYIATTDDTCPATPSQTDEQKRQNDYVPPGWSDEPVTGTYVWISSRVRHAGSDTAFGEFGTPSPIPYHAEKGAPVAEQRV